MSLLFGNLLLNVSGIVPPSVRGMIFHWLVPMKTMISVTTAAHAKVAARQIRWKRQRRTGDALPRQAQRVVEQGHALLKEAKGLGRPPE